MKLYSETGEFKLYHGSMLDMVNVIAPGSIDSVVTDPPYELNFMNKGWDNSGIAFQASTWRQCYTVLKPGGYLLAFGGSRTFHRIACAIEDAGFEIRDTIMWLYGSGFPKSMNLGKAVESKLINGSANTQDFRKLKGEMVATGDWGMGKLAKEQGFRSSNYWEDKHLRIDKVDYQTAEGQQWDGWGTTLKPAYEPVIVARKPCEGSCVDNVLRYGVGGINIDECRVGVEERSYKGAGSSPQKIDNHEKGDTGICMLDGSGKDLEFTVNGRFPANVILTYDDTDKDEVCGGMPETAEESASRYFYCAKASKRDRDEGLEQFEDRPLAYSNRAQAELKRGNIEENLKAGGMNSIQIRKNTHPTVKPTELMQYLVRLVTPKGGIVLDPFNGSGSTGKATMYENRDRNAGYKYIGIELTEEYLPIADARIRYAMGDTSPVEYMEMPKNSSDQISIFDLMEDKQ
jgi:site-specific DNA-methyltransferase (adenine-specific)